MLIASWLSYFKEMFPLSFIQRYLSDYITICMTLFSIKKLIVTCVCHLSVEKCKTINPLHRHINCLTDWSDIVLIAVYVFVLFFFSPGSNLSEEELNALLSHAHQRIFQLKRNLRAHQLMEDQRRKVCSWQCLVSPGARQWRLILLGQIYFS